MKAIVARQSLPADHPAALVDVELPVPAPGPRDVLVDVKAVSVNPVDTKVRGGMPAEPGEGRVLGWDAAGVVKEVGREVTLFKPGDEVWYAGDLTRPGSNAEWQVVDERIVGHKPASLGFAEAAALPLTSITAWELLFDRLEVGSGAGKRLLVVGAAGGVGSILLQLARAMTSLTVIATASRPETMAWVREMGAHEVIDHREPLNEGLQRLGITEVDYVVSLNQTDRHFDAIVASLKPQGKLALIDDPKPLDVLKLKRKSLSLHWAFMYTRSMFATDDMIRQHELLERVAELVDAGRVRSTLTRHLGALSAATLREAHGYIETGKAVGKVVLEWR